MELPGALRLTGLATLLPSAPTQHSPRAVRGEGCVAAKGPVSGKGNHLLRCTPPTVSFQSAASNPRGVFYQNAAREKERGKIHCEKQSKEDGSCKGSGTKELRSLERGEHSCLSLCHSSPLSPCSRSSETCLLQEPNDNKSGQHPPGSTSQKLLKLRGEMSRPVLEKPHKTAWLTSHSESSLPEEHTSKTSGFVPLMHRRTKSLPCQPAQNGEGLLWRGMSSPH